MPIRDRLLRRLARLTEAADDLVDTRPGPDRKAVTSRILGAYRDLISDPDWVPVMNDPSTFDREYDPISLAHAMDVEDGKLAAENVRRLVSWMLLTYEEAVRDDRGTKATAIYVDPGTAPPEDIADILSDLSILYRRMGGSGIKFALQDVHFLAPVLQ